MVVAGLAAAVPQLAQPPALPALPPAFPAFPALPGRRRQVSSRRPTRRPAISRPITPMSAR